MFEFASGFVLGVIGDALRSILAPATTVYIRKKLSRLFPSIAARVNEETNLKVLQDITTAKAAGVDIESVSYLQSSPDIFLRRIGFAKATFLELGGEFPDHAESTQAELNQESLLDLQTAKLKLDHLVRTLETHERLTDREREAFKKAQSAWLDFHATMLQPELQTWQEGSGAGMILACHSTALILERIGHLSVQLADLKATR